MKKFTALLLALALLSSMSALAEVCSEGEQVRPFRILSQTMVTGYPEDDADNLSIQEITRRTGVEFTVEGYSDSTEYRTKLSLSVASGDMPDLWYGSVADVMEWKNQGLIIPLTDLIEKYGQDMLPYIYPSALDAFTFDGEIWGLPSMYLLSEPGNDSASTGMLLREDWLDNLSLSAPTTLDELHDVLYQFTYNDPDGNGVNDTYGMGQSSSVLSNGSNSFNLVYNAFGVVANYWKEQADGTIVKGFMTDEFEQALEVLRAWYAEGIIDPEFPVMSNDNVIEKIIASKVGGFMMSAWTTDATAPTEASLKALVPEGNITAYSSVVGPNGDQGVPAAFSSWRTIVISATCKQPELLMKFLNWFSLDVENWLLSENGIRGVHWDFDENGDFYRIEPYVNQTNLYAEGFCNATRIQTMTDRRYNTDEVLNAIAAINASGVIDNALWATTTAETEYADIESDMAATVIKIVQGEEDMDVLYAARERYLSSGGQAIQDEANEIYATMK